MTRAFVAVVPPADVLDAVEEVLAGTGGLPEGAKPTRREQWHLTLQFLGNRADVDAVGGALAALAVAPGRLALGGGGAFPSARRGRVLWIGLRMGAEWLAQVAAAVGALLAPLGHEPEARPYHGHLTLARWKTPADLRPVVDALGDGAVGPEWTASEVVLFESRLRRTGAEYEPRLRVPLSPG